MDVVGSEHVPEPGHIRGGGSIIDIFHAPECSTRLVNMPILKSSLCASLRSSRLLPLCSHVSLCVCHRPCGAGSSGAGSSSCSMQLAEQLAALLASLARKRAAHRSGQNSVLSFEAACCSVAVACRSQ